MEILSEKETAMYNFEKFCSSCVLDRIVMHCAFIFLIRSLRILMLSSALLLACDISALLLAYYSHGPCTGSFDEMAMY